MRHRSLPTSIQPCGDGRCLGGDVVLVVQQRRDQPDRRRQRRVPQHVPLVAHGGERRGQAQRIEQRVRIPPQALDAGMVGGAPADGWGDVGRVFRVEALPECGVAVDGGQHEFAQQVGVLGAGAEEPGFRDALAGFVQAQRGLQALVPGGMGALAAGGLRDGRGGGGVGRAEGHAGSGNGDGPNLAAVGDFANGMRQLDASFRYPQRCAYTIFRGDYAMKPILLAFAAVLALAAFGAPTAQAANARKPYGNIDRSNDKGNDTGDSQVDRLNDMQLERNYAGPRYPVGTPPPPFAPMPPGASTPPAGSYTAPVPRPRG
jgi:hypothetical protein